MIEIDFSFFLILFATDSTLGEGHIYIYFFFIFIHRLPQLLMSWRESNWSNAFWNIFCPFVSTCNLMNTDFRIISSFKFVCKQIYIKKKNNSSRIERSLKIPFLLKKNYKKSKPFFFYNLKTIT